METITFANQAYLPVLANWLLAMRRIGREGVAVYALDDTTRAFVENSGFEARIVSAGQGLGALWALRSRVFRDLVACGTSFVHSDADAVWLRDLPVDFVDPSDLCFSQGTTHPRVAYKETGFVVCCGLFGVRACAETEAFFARLVANVERTEDDQRSVNNILRKCGATWTRPNRGYEVTAARGTSIRCWDQPVTGRCEATGLTLRMVPHWMVQRVPDHHPSSDGAYIKHHLSPKAAAAKLAMFERRGLCFLRKDWQDVKAPGAIDDYLPRS